MAEDIEELNKKLELCEKERDEYLNGWRRAKADLANYKNEELARLEEVVKFGNADIIKELIPVLDSFNLALTMAKQSPFQKDLLVLLEQLGAVLKKRGLEKITVKTGERFDPKLHEVIEGINSEAPPDTILEEVAPGYTLHGKIIRPAKVKVSK